MKQRVGKSFPGRENSTCKSLEAEGKETAGWETRVMSLEPSGGAWVTQSLAGHDENLSLYPNDKS